MNQYALHKALPLLFILCLPLSVSASEMNGSGTLMTDLAGNTISNGGQSAMNGYATTSDGMGIQAASYPPSNLTKEDYQLIALHAVALLTQGRNFRRTEIQNLAEDKLMHIDNAWNNFDDYSEGKLLDRFCWRDAQSAGMTMQVDTQGYCTQTHAAKHRFDENAINEDGEEKYYDIRNRLIRARELFGTLVVAEPPSIPITLPPQRSDEPECFQFVRAQTAAITAQELGKACLLESTREIAYAHMIFGNEYLIDAFTFRYRPTVRNGDDYRLTGRLILEKELAFLEKAQEQYELATGVLMHALNAHYGGPGGIHIGNFFAADEFKLYGIISQRLAELSAEKAERLRRLYWRDGTGDQHAADLYQYAYETTYHHLLALSAQATKNNVDFFENNGWELKSTLERLQAETNAITLGSDPFGFPAGYVPLSKYSCITKDVFDEHTAAASTAAATAEANIQRFEQNADELSRRLTSIDNNYINQLTELCGPDPEKRWDICEAPGRGGGLITQNRIDLDLAWHNLQDTQLAIEHNREEIADMQEKNSAIRVKIVEAAEADEAIEIAKAIENAEKCTESQVVSNSVQRYRKESTTNTKSTSIFGKIVNTVRSGVAAVKKVVGAIITGGGSELALAIAGADATADVVDIYETWAGKEYKVTEKGVQRTELITKQRSCVWDPEQRVLGEMSGRQVMLNAISNATIRGIEKDFLVRDLLRNHARLENRRHAALLEWDKRLEEQAHLNNRYHILIDARSRDIQTVTDSYLNNPSHRILKDDAVLDAEQALDQAIQYAYLAAKSIEYEYALPMAKWPKSSKVEAFDIFTASTAQNVEEYRLYLNRIKADFNALVPSPKTPRIRLATDIVPDGSSFSDWLRSGLDNESNMISLPFQTSLASKNALGEHIFNVDRFNERITGIRNQDLDSCTPWFVSDHGIRCDVQTRGGLKFLKAPTITLKHRSPGEYRNQNGDIVYFTPGRVELSAYDTRPHISFPEMKAGLSCTVDGKAVVEGSETHNGELFNRSVAADWEMVINLTENAAIRENLDLIEDIVITIDTVSFTLQQ